MDLANRNQVHALKELCERQSSLTCARKPLLSPRCFGTSDAKVQVTVEGRAVVYRGDEVFGRPSLRAILRSGYELQRLGQTVVMRTPRGGTYERDVRLELSRQRSVRGNTCGVHVAARVRGWQSTGCVRKRPSLDASVCSRATTGRAIQQSLRHNHTSHSFRSRSGGSQMVKHKSRAQEGNRITRIKCSANDENN